MVIVHWLPGLVCPNPPIAACGVRVAWSGQLGPCWGAPAEVQTHPEAQDGGVWWPAIPDHVNCVVCRRIAMDLDEASRRDRSDAAGS